VYKRQGQGLQVDLFEPKEESNKEFYAEKRIDVALRGSYHQLGAFFNDVASQPRLVAVVPDQMQVQIAKEEKADKTKAKNGDVNDAINVGESLEKSDLIFTGSVITYRYMSEDEIMANAEEAESKDKNGKRVRKKEADGKK
jgi:Tfp pilus assembly protein PilO